MANRLCQSKSVVPWDPVACNPKLTLVQKGFMKLFKNYGGAVLNDNCAIRMVLPDGSEAFIGNKDAKPADLATVRVRDGGRTWHLPLSKKELDAPVLAVAVMAAGVTPLLE